MGVLRHAIEPGCEQVLYRPQLVFGRTSSRTLATPCRIVEEMYIRTLTLADIQTFYYVRDPKRSGEDNGEGSCRVIVRPHLCVHKVASSDTYITHTHNLSSSNHNLLASFLFNQCESIRPHAMGSNSGESVSTTAVWMYPYLCGVRCLGVTRVECEGTVSTSGFTGTARPRPCRSHMDEGLFRRTLSDLDAMEMSH